MKKKQETFVKSEKVKYKVRSDMKLKFTNLVALVLNHRLFPYLRDMVINLTLTGVTFWFIVWSMYYQSNPLFKGFSIAVTLAVAQYYIKWFYGIKPKRNDTEFVLNDGKDKVSFRRV